MRALLLLFLLTGITTVLRAQNYTMNGTPINDCAGSFFDPGGPSADYGNNQNITTTLCAGGVGGGTHVRLDFSGLQLAAGDVLCFYDGTDATAPLLSCSDQYQPGAVVVVQATAANTSGCLTVVFTSNSTGTAPGWSAAISCVKSCQTINAQLISTTPATVPADTGWIDICPGQRITFNGQGFYPQNGLVYNQSDFTTSFEWNFGDGDIAYGPTVSHKFTESGGYYVQLLLRDTLGCASTNLVSQRVRVAPKPNFELANAYNSTICANDTLQLSAAVNAANSANNLGVSPGNGSFQVSGTRSDSLALPDGTGIPYSTSVYFTEFSPGQVLTDINDLEGICVNIEHSWARDIQIEIECPNGSSVILHNHPGPIGSQVYLGIPNDNDNFNPVPGSGYDYCWTPDATNPYWIQYFNSTNVGTLPEGDYKSFEPLTNLIGCPLNGEWTLTVTDYWPQDNGYIFSWGVNFNQDLYPAIETFSPNLVSWQWQPQSTIIYYSQDSIAASPTNAGIASYTFTTNDSYGCKWDTTLNVTVLPFTHPNCFSCQGNYFSLKDTTLCVGDPVQLNGAAVTGNTQEVRFEASPGYKFGASNHPHSNPYISPVAVNSLGYVLLTNPVQQIQSVCMDINTDFDADLIVYLRSPDNKQIELTSGNGGAGDNYKVTCFSPAASNPITGGTAPFNGTYAPEGAWTSLTGAQINGDWKLIVSDGFGQNQLGTLNSWNIGFNIPNNVTYAWNNSNGLSCNNCPDPIATPTTPTTYIMTATDGFNCVHKDTVTITAQNFFPAPTNLQVIQMQAGVMTWTWDALPNVTTYEININNTGWVSVSGTTYAVPGLNPGDNVAVQLRALGGSVNCPPVVATASKIFVACTLETTLNFTTPCSCYGYTDGAVDVLATGGQGQTVFYTNYGPNTPYVNGNLTFYPAGNYFVFAVDAQGCRDTTNFTITEPPRIDITPTTTVNVACFGTSTGSLSVAASGGTGNHTYLWSNCTGTGNAASGQFILNIPAGCYQVTVTDVTGCSNTSSFTITENPPLAMSTSQDSVSCFGGTDGMASVAVTGGEAPYFYLWSNSNTTATATNLPAGFHSVTVTDNANCSATTVVNVRQPQQLVVDSIVAGPESCLGKGNGLITVYPKGGTKPYAYAWSGGSGQTAVTAINLSSGNYTVTITDKNGCTVTAQSTVTAPAALLTSVSASAPVQCPNQCNGAATIQITGGTTPYSINWNTPTVPANSLSSSALCEGTYQISVTDANACTSQTTVTIGPATPINILLEPTNPSCPGVADGDINTGVSGGNGPFSYQWSNNATTANITALTCVTYTVTVTDANNCTQTATQTLTCPDAVILNGINATAVLCNGQNNGSATVSVSGGSGTYAYLWSGATAQTTASATNLVAGTYTVTVTDGQGCSLSATTTVTQPAALSASAIPEPVDCFNAQTGAVNLTVNGGTATYQYGWSNGATTQNISQIGANTYTVTITDSNNCTLVFGPVNVVQPSAPLSVSAVQTTTSCFGVPGGIATATASGGNGFPYDYQWSNNITTASATSLIPGTYTVTATDNKQCTATATVNITAYDSIYANILLIAPTCFGGTDGQAAVNLVLGGAGNGQASNYSYQWSGLPGAPTGEYWGNLPGNQPFSLTILDQAGCSRTYNLMLGEPIPVIPTLTVTNISCNGANDGRILISGHQGEHPLSAYNWNTQSTTDFIIDVAKGVYSVTVTDTEGCTGSASAIVTEPDPLSFTFNRTQIKCASDATGVLAALPTGGTAPYTFVWNTGSTEQVITQLPKGLYLVTVTDARGCSMTDSTRIDEPVAPTLTVSVQDVTCFNMTNGRIEIDINGGTAPYKYGLNEEPLGGSPIFIALEAGNYQIRVVDFNNCVYTTTANLASPPELQVAVSPDNAELTFGDQLVLVATSVNQQGVVRYTWDFDFVDSFKCVIGNECGVISMYPGFTNGVTVTATDEKGCIGETYTRYTVEKPRDIYVPTGFTPNGDNTNDLLNVFGKGRQVKAVSVFRIYDRWGELIYEDKNFKVNDINRGWDGTFRGLACDPGVYVWTAEVEYEDGYQDSFYGQTTLIR